MNQAMDFNQLQEIQNDILLYFKKICDENDIRYYLAYGTLLGAVRHSGFIPWDDDVDVMMSRPDYERFLKVWIKNPHSYYRLHSMHVDEKYPSPLAKIADERTILHNDYFWASNYQIGVNIDIFVLDGLPNNREEMVKHIIKSRKITKHFSFAVRGFEDESKSFARKFIRFFVFMIHRMIGYRCFLNKLDNLAKLYPYESSEYVGVVCFGENYKEWIKKDKIENPAKLNFENVEYMVPGDYDTYLSNIYGKYMGLPSYDQRTPIHQMGAEWKHEFNAMNKPSKETAIILAAGKGERMKPITDHTAKPLVKVNGVPMIETLLDGLKFRGVDKIYIVVGYKKEQFEYLTNKYSNIQLIENSEFDECNNISSLYTACDVLSDSDCFICEADLVVADKSIFEGPIYNSCYFGKMKPGYSDDWVFDLDGERISGIHPKGTNAYNMAGISYWKKKDAVIIKNLITEAYALTENKQLFWDEIINHKLNEICVTIKPVTYKQIIEIDTCEELDKVNEKKS